MRERIDQVRKIMLDAFMAEDMGTYANAVIELERLIGVPHGDRNPKANWVLNMLKDLNEDRCAKMRKAKKEKRIASETADGITTWSVKYR